MSRILPVYDKNTTQVTRAARPVPPILSAMGTVTGYEIHMGTTEAGTCREALGGGRSREQRRAGIRDVHARALPESGSSKCPALVPCMQKKACHLLPIPAMTADPYETLADLFEEHVDMDAIVALREHENTGR